MGVEAAVIHVGSAAEKAMQANDGVLPDGVAPDAELPENQPGERLTPREQKRARVLAAITSRLAPFGRVRLAYAPMSVMVLLVPPKLKPLRGVAEKDWRLELLVAPNERPTPKWRRYMNDRFGVKLCGLYRTTPNPTNPLPVSVEGWWWHAGCWLSAQLANGVELGRSEKPVTPWSNAYHLERARITPTEARRWSVWLEAKAAGIALPEVSP